MYCNSVLVDSVEHKTGVGKNNSQLWEVKFKDVRPKKDGGEYNAFSFKATFWGSTKPCDEGDFTVVSGDLVNNYWQDKDGNWQASPVLKEPKVLNMTSGEDETPKKEKAQEENEEIPF